MKALEFLAFISEINQLDHHQRTTLTKTLGQLEDEPKVYDLIETIFDNKGIYPHCSHAENYRHGIIDGFSVTDVKPAKRHLMLRQGHRLHICALSQSGLITWELLQNH